MKSKHGLQGLNVPCKLPRNQLNDTIMLATKKQITYLQHLADRAQFIKMRHPSLIPQGLMHHQWDIDMTSEKASARIDYYSAILRQCDLVLYPRKKVAENEDLPA